MDDLIYRQKAIEEILQLMKDMKLSVGDTTVYEGVTISPTEAVHVLRWMPSVDAVEVVRCKDCEWCAVCKVGQHLGLDGFCSKGERKKDG